MSQDNPNAPENVEDKPKTPLEIVQENQAMKDKSHEVEQQRPEPSPEIPGGSKPSTIRHHPQRQL